MPSWPSKVPVQSPVEFRVRAPPTFESPVPVRSVKVSLLIPRAVVVALVAERLGNVLIAVVEVEVNVPASAFTPRSEFPVTESVLQGDVVPIPRRSEKYDRPKTSRILFAVLVALLPIIRTSEVSEG